MAKDPTIPFYAQDFYMDTIQWEEDELGAYIRLLCQMWIDGFCYNSATGLANISPSAKKVIEKYRDKFTFHEDGRITNNRLEEERAKRIKNREIRSTAGKKGAKKRWQKDSKSDSKNIAKDMANDITKGKGKENDNETKKRKKKIKQRDEEIRRLVIAYYDIQHPKFPHELRNYKKNKDEFVNDSIDEIDKIIRIDGYTLEDVHRCLEFAIQDDFWQDKALSLRTLRVKSKTNDMKKFDNLYTRMKQSRKTGLGAIDDWVKSREAGEPMSAEWLND